jgi:predicted HD phosphohydrolase
MPTAVKRKHVEVAEKKSLKEMTPADIKLMNKEFGEVASNTKLAERMLKLLSDQKGQALGCCVDLYEHGLQTASRCYDDLKKRTPADAKGLTPAGLTEEDEELVVVALLHDIGETFSPINHGEMAAGMLRPFISPRNYWILMHHEIFQLYYYGEAAGSFDHTLRDKLKGSPHWDACEEFCLKWDQAAFDGDYDNYELAFFEPMVHRVVNKPVYAYPDHKDELINALKAGMAAGYPTAVAE